jgi:hypothetical protein
MPNYSLPADLGPVKLGKNPKKEDPRTLKMAKYYKAEAPPPIPTDFSFISLDTLITDWGMLGNDTIGDCVIAMILHMIESWAADNGISLTFTTQDAINLYSAVTGYDPNQTQPDGSNPTDNGTNELDALKYMQQTGYNGHKIGAFVQVDLSNIGEVMMAIYLFGGIACGVALPMSAQGEPNWDYPPDDQNTKDPSPGSWGGHGIPGLAYDAQGIVVITWANALSVDWAFFSQYFDEAYAIISPDYIDGTKPSPTGFDMATLTADLQLVTA